MLRILIPSFVLVFVAVAFGQDGLPTNQMRARELFYAVRRTGASPNVQQAGGRTGVGASNSGSSNVGNVSSSSARGAVSAAPVNSAQLALRYRVLKLSNG